MPEFKKYPKVRHLEVDLVEGQAAIAKIKPTFCFEILFEMQKKMKDRLILNKAHCTIDGYRHYVTDFDGQKYQIDIKPIREEVNKK